MRLFAKILLWFLFTTTVTFVGASYFVQRSFQEQQNRQGANSPLFGRILSIELREAHEAYETGGKDALARVLGRFEEGSYMRTILTGTDGRDLLTGTDYSRNIQAAQQRRGPPPVSFYVFGGPHRPPRAEIARRSQDGQYTLLFIPNRLAQSPDPPGFGAPQIWMISAIITLCGLLAWYLTAPLRGLQRTLERFGKGDFSARAGSSRRDELGRLARTFDVMAERIEILLKAEKRLLLDISHELRSPLTRLGVSVEIARSGGDAETALVRIQREADRLNSLVDQLLQVTRAENEPGALRHEPVRLDEVLRQVADDCGIEASARGTSIQLDALPLSVDGDPELLRRTTENIIRNAVRFSPPEKPIEVSEERHGKDAIVRIRDYGPGVPEGELTRIFDNFYRVDTDRNRLSGGGVGLGLSIARRAVELHGGRIHARNADPGLLVQFTIPIAAKPGY